MHNFVMIHSPNKTNVHNKRGILQKHYDDNAA